MMSVDEALRLLDARLRDTDYFACYRMVGVDVAPARAQATIGGSLDVRRWIEPGCTCLVRKAVSMHCRLWGIQGLAGPSCCGSSTHDLVQSLLAHRRGT